MLKELYEKKGKAIADARALNDLVTKENRAMTDEESERYDRFNDDIDTIQASIDRGLALSEREVEHERQAKPTGTNLGLGNAGGAGDTDRSGGEPGGGETREASPTGTQEYRDAFVLSMRNKFVGAEHNRELSVGVDADGGYLVPDRMHNNIIKAMEDRNKMRQLCTVLGKGAGDLEMAIGNADGVAYYGDEGDDPTETSETFDSKTVNDHWLSYLIKATLQMLQDNAFGIEQYIEERAGAAMGAMEEEKFIKGTGVKMPRGLVLDITQGITAASPTAITADEILELIDELPEEYEDNARFMFNRKTRTLIRKLKGSDGHYMWQPGMQAGVPDLLEGFEHTTSKHVDQVAATKETIIFGDFKKHTIFERKQISVQRLGEVYATQKKVGFLFLARNDSLLLEPKAFAKLTQAA